MAYEDDWQDVDTQQPIDEGPETTGAVSQAAPADEWVDVGAPAQDDKWVDVGKEPPDAEGVLGTVAREAGHSIIPTAGSIAAMGAGVKIGGALGLPLGPWGVGGGMIAGGLLAGLGGGYLLTKAQDWVADKFGWNDTEQRAANAEANPKSALVGQLAPSAAAFGPGLAAKIPWALRGAMAGLGGGLEAGEQLATEGEISHPGKVAVAAGFQGVFANPNKFGTALMAPGEKAAEAAIGIFRPGRPGTSPPTTPPLPQGAPGVAATPTPPQGARAAGGQAVTTSPTIGNPQSAVSGSTRVGAKNAPVPGAPGPMTTGDIPPDQAAALENLFGGPGPAVNRPAPPPTNQPDPHLVAASKELTPAAVHDEMSAPRGEADFGDAAIDQATTRATAGAAGATPPADAVTEASRMHREVEADVHRRISDRQTGEQKPDNYTGEERRHQDRTAAPQSKEPVQQAAASYDHPDLPNVKVARDQDGTRFNEDTKTVSIDARMPKQIDVNGMALDPALPLAVREVYTYAGAKALQQEIAAGKHAPMSEEHILNNAREHGGKAAERKYLEEEMGFTKEDLDRYQQIIKETEGTRAGTDAPIETGLAPEVPVQEHKPSVKAAIDLLRSKGMEERAQQIEAAAPEAALLLARQARRALGDVSLPRKLEGGVTVASKADAARKQGAIDVVKKVFDKWRPETDEVPVTPAQIATLRSRLEKAVAEAGDAIKYKPRERSPELRWLQAARKFLNSQPTPKNVGEFIASEKLTRSGNPEDAAQVGATQRIESDIELRRRPTVDEAEGKINHEFPGEPVTREELTRADVPPKELDLSKATPEELEQLGTALADEKLGEQIAEAEPKWKAAEEKRVADQAQRTAQLRALREAGKTAPKAEDTIGDILKRFGKAEGAAVGQGKPQVPLGRVARGVNDFISAKRDANALAAQQARDPGYMARDARNIKDERGRSAEVQERYARDQSDKLHTLGQQDAEHAKGILNEIEKMPEPLRKDAKIKDVIYLAREAGKEGHLPAAEKSFYDTHIKPILDQNEKMYDAIEAIFPKTLGPKVLNHIMRIRQGVDSDTLFGASQSADPMGSRNLKTGRKTTMHDRVFMALERDTDGHRVVISPNDDGFAVWNKYKKTDIKAPLEFKAGEEITVNGAKYKVVEAMTPEIEKNARFENGTVAKYYHDPILSATVANHELATTLRHMQYMHDLKQDPAFLKWATLNYDQAKAKGWEHSQTDLPQFKDWFMDNRLKMVMDDYALSGFKGLETMRQLSTGVTKLLFWMPTAHAMNVAAHWFVERGFDWITPKEYYHLAVEGTKAIQGVMTQDAYQQYLLRNGAGTILPRIKLGTTQKFMTEVGKAMEIAITSNPSKWDPIAKIFGMRPSTLGRAVYDASQKLMWAASDMMLTQSIMANERRGMTIKQAIDAAERHIPNYRMPTELIASGKFGRFMAKAMGDQAVVAFGRYHYGMLNSFANMGKDLTSGNAARRNEAVGNLMAMALLAFAVKPVLDTMASYVTGNEKAEVYPRGPLTIPTHVVKAAQGKEDIMAAVRGVTTNSPLFSTGVEIMSNRDFAGRDIHDKATVSRAMGGDMTAAGRVAVQQGHHLAAGLISPYGTFTQGMKAGKDPVDIIRDAALDIKNPSERAKAYEAKSPLFNQQKEISRFKKPPSVVEDIYNKVFGR